MSNHMMVRVDTHYGTKRYYPACQQSRLILDLLRTREHSLKTIPIEAINRLKREGWTVEAELELV